MAVLTKAGPQVCNLLNEIKAKNHPHLETALIACGIVDTKPYVHNKLNLGKVSKFSKGMKLWLPKETKYDFLVTLVADVWFGLFNEQQKEAWLDLLLTRCQVEYEPNCVEINGKLKPVKDEFGRVEYTDKPKTDDSGQFAWKVAPLDMAVIASNISRYGVWFDSYVQLKVAIDSHKEEVQ